MDAKKTYEDNGFFGAKQGSILPRCTAIVMAPSVSPKAWSAALFRSLSASWASARRSNG